MTDADETMNPQHFGSGPADIWIRIRINSENRMRIRINPGIIIRIPDHDVRAVWEHSLVYSWTFEPRTRLQNVLVPP